MEKMSNCQMFSIIFVCYSRPTTKADTFYYPRWFAEISQACSDLIYTNGKSLHRHITQAEIVLHVEETGVSEVVMSSSLSVEHSTHTRSRERLTSGDPLSASYIADRAVVRGFYQRCLWNLRVAEQASHWGARCEGGGWFSTVEEVMHTQSSGDTVAWWLAAGLPECEESQPALLAGSNFLTTCCPMLYKLWHVVLTFDLDLKGRWKDSLHPPCTLFFQVHCPYSCPHKLSGMAALYVAPSRPRPHSSHSVSVITALLMRVPRGTTKGTLWDPLATVKRKPPSLNLGLMWPGVWQLSICSAKPHQILTERDVCRTKGTFHHFPRWNSVSSFAECVKC